MFHIRSLDLTHLMTELYPCTNLSIFSSILSPWPSLFYSLFLCVCLFFFAFYWIGDVVFTFLWRRKWQPTRLLAWEFSWRKKPEELQSLIFQKVGLNLGTKPPPPSFTFYIWISGLWLLNLYIQLTFIFLFFYQTISHFKSPTFLLSRPLH